MEEVPGSAIPCVKVLSHSYRTAIAQFTDSDWVRPRHGPRAPPTPPQARQVPRMNRWKHAQAAVKTLRRHKGSSHHTCNFCETMHLSICVPLSRLSILGIYLIVHIAWLAADDDHGDDDDDDDDDGDGGGGGS